MNSRFVVNGGKKLKGEIEVKGAKNAALKVFAASILTSGTIRIKNVPEVEDIVRMSELLKNLGVEVIHLKHGEYQITAAKIKTSAINSEIAKSFGPQLWSRPHSLPAREMLNFLTQADV